MKTTERTQKQLTHDVAIAIRSINEILEDYKQREAPIIKKLTQMRNNARDLKNEANKISIDIDAMIKYLSTEAIKYRNTVIKEISDKYNIKGSHLNAVGGYDKQYEDVVDDD
jgi:hypothetical protein